MKRGRRSKESDGYRPLLKWTSAILLVATGVILALGFFGAAGFVGSQLFQAAYAAFGVGSFVLPILIVSLGIFIGFEWPLIERLPLAGSLIVAIAALALIGLFSGTLGGALGFFIGSFAENLFGFWGSLVLLAAIALVGLVIAADVAAIVRVLLGVLDGARAARLPRIRFASGPSADGTSENEDERASEKGIKEEKRGGEEPAEEREPVISVFNDSRAGKSASAGIRDSDAEYEAPPLSLLGGDSGKPGVGDIKANANIIKRTFQNFGIPVEMDEVSVGPTVTRYAIKPAEGVRLSKIVSLQNNLELALAAHPVRIEAPIPGKSLVGIEVPNSTKATVGLGGVLSAPEWQKSGKPLLAALGRDITGTPHYVNIAKMPHGLVAGATGSGKTCGKDTYVFSEKGMLTFDELCPLPLNTEREYALRLATRDGIETTSKNYNNGICDFYKITTEDGFSIEVTAEHPLWTLEDGAMGWKSGSAIRTGDFLAISRGTKLFGKDEAIAHAPAPHKTNKARAIRIPATMTKELGLFMGLLTADGGLTVGHHRIVYTQANEEVLRLYQNLLATLFGFTAYAVKKSGQSNKAKDVIVYSKQLKDFLFHLGMKAVGAREKEIPRSIRESGRETIAAFIQGLIRNDGHVSRTGLEITLANEKLLRQLQIILLNFGVVAALHKKNVKGYEHNDYWRLSVYGDDFVAYAAEIGFLTAEERERAEKILARKRNTNWNTVPTLSPLVKKIGALYRNTYARLTNCGLRYAPEALVPTYAFNSLRSYASGARRPSYGALDAILALYKPLAASAEYQRLADIRTGNFYFAKVATIEETRGVGYDFEVPGSNSFVGNGFVNHNSVAIHALITSLLYRNGPNQLRLIMIDPKRVELTAYNGIPHLLTHVITDPKKTILSLKWAAKEMERRYNILEAESVRDIESYHASVFEPSKKRALRAPHGGASGDRSLARSDVAEALPYIVIVIDELADIMSSYPRELEAAIVRLAQMSRAVGIHLVLSTQRPSVNVITGLIKANVPTRMALQVASQIDSRTILDSGGAENLLGAGDMLYLSSDMQKPVRIQTAYISEGEVKKVVRYIKEHNAGDLSSLDLGGNGTENGGDAIAASFAADDDAIDDDLYAAARSAVEEAGRASTSYLQRKLRIGYSRAARLMDVLEEKGVIGPADGSKPREVLSRGGASAGADEEPA